MITDERIQAFSSKMQSVSDSMKHRDDFIQLSPQDMQKIMVKAALEAYEQSKWTPIDERVKNGDYYLIFQPDTAIPDQTVACWDSTWGDDGWWLVCDGKNPEIPLRGAEPTHYKLLTPPKE